MSPTTFGVLATRWASYLVPLTTTFAVTLFAVLPLPIPYYNFAAPSLTLIAIYYWTVFRPDLMPMLVLFGIGIVNDALSGAPLGVSSLVFLVLQVAVHGQRRYLVGQPFWMLWSGFALIVPLAALFQWIVLSVLRGQPLAVHAFSVIMPRRNFSGSCIGGIAETQEMLDFCAQHGIVSDIELISIQQINEAWNRMIKQDVRYRFVIDMASLKTA